MNKECNEKKKKKQKFCATKMNVEWDARQASINNNSNNSTQQTAVHCFEAKYSLCVCVVFADCKTFLATKNCCCWTAAALKRKSTALYQTVKILKAIFGAALRKGKHDNTCGKYTHTDPIKIEHGKMDGKSDSRHTHKMLKNWPKNDFQQKQGQNVAKLPD